MLEHLKNELQSIIKDYPSLKMQIYIGNWQTDFLRFFKSQTNYNISKNTFYANVSLYKDQKNYSFSVCNPTAELIKDKIDQAIPILEKLPPDPDFVDLEKDQRKATEQPKECNITKLPLNKKVEILKQFRDAVQPFDFDIYGTFICNFDHYFILNSNGLDKKVESSPFYLEVKAVSNKNEVTVLECFGGENLDKLNVSAMVDNLTTKVKNAQNEVVDVEAGDYEVILAPRCIGDLMVYYAWTAIADRSIDQQDTDLVDKIGQKVFPTIFSLYDAPKHPDVVQKNYSKEGFLVDDLPIFENGVFKNFLVDNYYANKLKMKENGNQGDCLVVKTGDISLHDMIKSVKKGLYISSFHYMNFINTRESSLTGLTRDGTFLIEDGKITKVVNNLRFTEKITDVINNITAIENQAYTIPASDNYGSFSINAQSMPHVRVKEFNISSSTRTV